MYMSATVGIAELRQNLSKFLKQVREGERIVVTDHGKPIAEIGPPPSGESHYDRLIREGRLKPAKVPGGIATLGPPLPRVEGERPLSELLIEERDEERL